MHRKHQRGTLSLLWAAVFVGIISLVAMVALMSARYERNYFAGFWKRINGTEAGKSLQQSQQSLTNAVKGNRGGIWKCVVDGRTVYSNVECASGNSALSARRVELHENQGFDAPNGAPGAAATEAAELRGRVLDAMIRQ